jgi:tetratricopeptide (TPR) repeat protein
VHAYAYGEGIDDALSREIRAHIQRAMQLDGDNPTVIARLVPAYAQLGDGDTCLRLARRAVELCPNLPFSHFALGLAYLVVGRTADAIVAAEEHDRLTPPDLKRSASLVLLGVCYWLEGKPGEAETAVDRALALHPDWDMALHWKAILAAQRGQEQAARDLMKRLREVEPTKSLDQQVRGMWRYPSLRERLAEAIAILRRRWDETGGEPNST